MLAENRIACLRLASIFALSVLMAGAVPAESPVADAAQQNDAEAVRTLLRGGADANAAQADGLTGLHWAALNDNRAILDLLLYAGATVKPLTRVGAYAPLHLAARRGNSEIVRALLEAGAEPNAFTSTGVAALHFAAQANSAEAIQALVEFGADVDAPDAFQSRTPLIFAASRNATVAAQALLAAGADPALQTDLKDYTQRLERDREDQSRHSRVLQAESGEPAGRGGRGGRPGRQQGAPAGRGGSSGASADTTSTPDTTATPDTAAAVDTTATPDPTAAPDPDPEPEPDPQPDPDEPSGEPDEKPDEKPDDEEPAEPPIRALSSNEQLGVQGGFTALHYVARQGHIATALLLLDGGADVDQLSGGDQSSPLLVAVINGNYDLAKMFIERGADPNLLSDDQAGPLFATLNIEWSLRTWYPQPQMFRSQETSYMQLLELLLEAGADPNQRTSTHIWYAAYNAGRMGVDFTGATPFWRAAYATDVKAMRLLVAYGADPNIWTTKLPSRRRFVDPDVPNNPDNDEEEPVDPSGLPPVPIGGHGIHPMHAASGVGFGTSRVAQQHRSVPGGWLPAMKYFVEELGVDPNLRDMDGFTPLHHSAARADNETILYLVERGADVTLISRRGQTTADMANSPEQRAQPHPATIALLEKLGSKNNHNCRSCGSGR